MKQGLKVTVMVVITVAAVAVAAFAWEGSRAQEETARQLQIHDQRDVYMKRNFNRILERTIAEEEEAATRPEEQRLTLADSPSH